MQSNTSNGKTVGKTVARKEVAPARKAVAPKAVGARNGGARAATVKAPAELPDKDKKVRMVRDSLSIPKNEYAVLAELKLRAGKLAVPVKKTELIRAGIKALAALPDSSFLRAIRAVPSLKTGRPPKSA